MVACANFESISLESIVQAIEIETAQEMPERTLDDRSEFIRLLERAARPLLRVDANRLAGPLSRILATDTAGMVSLMLALQGDFRHAELLVERVLPKGSQWLIEPAPQASERRSHPVHYEVRMGEARAAGQAPALVVVAALLRAVGRP